MLLYSFIHGHFPALFPVVLLYSFIPNNSALFPAILLYSFIPGHVTVQHYSRPFQVLFPTVFDCSIPVDHCLDHNKGCRRPHSYCVYRQLRLKSAKVTALIATGAGKGRNTRQSWGLQSGPILTGLSRTTANK